MVKKTDIDWHKFFHGEQGVRRTLFRKGLSRKQVAGCERLTYWALDRFNSGIDRTAYYLATSYHETAYRMSPVRETLASTDWEAARRLENAWRKGQLRWVRTPYWRKDADGFYWFGRGEVQLTHRANYAGPLRQAVLQEFGPKFDILKDPSILVRQPDVSSFILIEGMSMGHTGVSDFTSSSIEDFIHPGKCDFVGARRTVNPGDKSSYVKIAGEAEAFRNAIQGALR
jgi:hypothetical protein